MAYLVEFEGKAPRVAEGVFLAPTAVLIGDVVVEEGASIWFGAVLRADFGRIVVGRGTSVQDNVVIHPDGECIIGPNVTIGHLALLEGCVVEEQAVIGVGAVVLERARVGRRAIVAAGSVVTNGMEVPAETLVAGAPAQVKKALSGNARWWVENAAREYQELRLRYLQGARVLPSIGPS
ncbi:2,3,4,5-tetrahydropyridine-2,6-dicarboxylate N-acetyltransferase [bacterium HR24]|nr:2,3,4,5-tetrahydropyridine-2,6-dicarboxylate N-acetyltransferase [bacterium HR24]